MMQLPGRISVPTAKLLALLELAEWGARSAAERVLVGEVQSTIQNAGMEFQAAQMLKGAVEDEDDQQRSDSGAKGTESPITRDSDGGGAGAESSSPSGGVVGVGEQRGAGSLLAHNGGGAG